jgi:hypothetical protein
MTKQEAHKVVEKLGFTVRKGKEIFYLYKYKGRLVHTTAIPKGKGPLHVENDFRQQLRISRDQLTQAIKCPFGAPEYIAHLKAKDIIEDDDAEETKPSGKQ